MAATKRPPHILRAERRAREAQALLERQARLKPHVCFATVCPGLVTSELFGTFVQLLSRDMQTSRHIDGFICKKSGGLLSIFRNGVVTEFMQDTDSDWLWMVDSDIVLQDNTLDLLMAAAAANPDALIVSGWYIIPMYEAGNRATIYDWVENDFEYAEVPKETCFVDSVGLGCVMVHRKLLLAMYEKYGRPSPWFTLIERTTDKARIFGEDHSFFLRTREDFGQHPLLVPEAFVGHMKGTMLTQDHLSLPEEQ